MSCGRGRMRSSSSNIQSSQTASDQPYRAESSLNPRQDEDGQGRTVRDSRTNESAQRVTIGVVIVSIMTFICPFMGYRFIHKCASVAWIPMVIVFLVMLGVGAKDIVAPTRPTDPAAVLSFTSLMFSSVVIGSTTSPDFGVHHAPTSSWRTFLYVYLGMILALPCRILGVLFAASALDATAWNDGFDGGSNIGGLMESVLSVSGDFGKFLITLSALCIAVVAAPTLYSSSSFMAISPVFAKIPRCVYACIYTASLIPVSILGAAKFYNVLVDIISLAGYWIAAFVAIVLTDHCIISHGRWETYNAEDWNDPH
ncbi:hypothetical protein BV25DRAFT_1830307 [Artomyces pyxidatus]|uniref:Uncharacterized protein n=1 Tax=Artomyces pyxidatus TaxID=48021 RepID=A0ACB8SNS1_9AGAM|nr:hypothetical protein BV25DRAFT_1830307 [Artomyces pyxidatus]